MNEANRAAIDGMTRVLEWQYAPVMGEPENAPQKLLDGLEVLRSIKNRARDYGVADTDIQGLIGLVMTAAGIEGRDLEDGSTIRR